MKIGFDNDKYLKMQSEHIRERINQFGNKLYMEFGESFLMIIMLPVFFPVLRRTASCACSCSSLTRL